MFIEFWTALIERPDFWAILTLPPVTAFVTWAHVWMALYMLFHPIHYIGFKPFGLPILGWQGIVPRKAGKISGIIVDQTLSKLGSLEEFFKAMDPEEMAELMSADINENIETIIDELMLERRPAVWKKVPYAIKRRLYQTAREQLPETLKDLVVDLTYNVEHLVDMREMVVSRMENDRALMVNMFLRVGQKEINFIWHISAAIGFFFGIVQMFVYIFVPDEWKHQTVPLFAAIWGFLTNWIAILMVFNPLEPIYVKFPKFFEFKKHPVFVRPVKPCMGVITLQGAFMKRQAEVSEVFSAVVVEDLVTVKNIMHEMMYGKHKDKTRAVLKSHLLKVLEQPVVSAGLNLSLGPRDYKQFKSDLIDRSIEVSMVPISSPMLNKSRGQKIYHLFKERILALTPREFENLLRPAFKEDELTLIILGAVTGAMAGFIHLILAFV